VQARVRVRVRARVRARVWVRALGVGLRCSTNLASE